MSESTPETAQADKIRVYMNDSLGKRWSRGKYAAHVGHAVLKAFGVHPDIPIVVLGAKPREIENMATVIHDAGKTELEPGTLTAGTDFDPTPFHRARMATVAKALFEYNHGPGWDEADAADRDHYFDEAFCVMDALGFTVPARAPEACAPAAVEESS